MAEYQACHRNASTSLRKSVPALSLQCTTRVGWVTVDLQKAGEMVQDDVEFAVHRCAKRALPHEVGPVPGPKPADKAPGSNQVTKEKI